MPSLGTLSFYWAALFSFKMRAFNISYSILFCYIGLLSFGSLLFSEGKIMGVDPRDEGGAGSWAERSKGNCSQMYVCGKNLFSIKKTHVDTA